MISLEFHYECVKDKKCVYCHRDTITKPTCFMKFIDPKYYIFIIIK